MKGRQLEQRSYGSKGGKHELMYFGSTVESNRGFGKEAKKRVQAGWRKAICNKRVAEKIKEGSQTSNVIRFGDSDADR